MVLGHLATTGVWSKDVGWPDVGVFDLLDLRGQRVPEELWQSHLLSDVLWGCWWPWGSSQWRLEAVQGGRWLGGHSQGASLGCLNIWRTWNASALPESDLTLLGGAGELGRDRGSRGFCPSRVLGSRVLIPQLNEAPDALGHIQNLGSNAGNILLLHVWARGRGRRGNGEGRSCRGPILASFPILQG